MFAEQRARGRLILKQTPTLVASFFGCFSFTANWTVCFSSFERNERLIICRSMLWVPVASCLSIFVSMAFIAEAIRRGLIFHQSTGSLMLGLIIIVHLAIAAFRAFQWASTTEHFMKKIQTMYDERHG